MVKNIFTPNTFVSSVISPYFISRIRVDLDKRKKVEDVRQKSEVMCRDECSCTLLQGLMKLQEKKVAGGKAPPQPIFETGTLR
jgi:hypothetical protein